MPARIVGRAPRSQLKGVGRGAGGRPAAGGRARSEAEGRGAEVSRGHGDAAAALSEADEGRWDDRGRWTMPSKVRASPVTLFGGEGGMSSFEDRQTAINPI